MTDLPLVDDCWNRIGVKGDGSCPELKTVGHCHNCPVFASAGQTLFERQPPPEYVAEWTRRLAADDGAAPANLLAVVVFRLGEEWLCLDVRSAVEVAPVRAAKRIPHRSDRLLKGLVDIRGELLLAVDLRELLGIDTAAPANGEARDQPRLLVIEGRRQRWVFRADEVVGVHRLPTTELAEVPATVARAPSPFTRGVFDWKGRHVGLLAEDRLFDALARRIG